LISPILAFMALLGLAGCAKRGQDQVVPGKTDVNTLKATLGEPERVTSPAIRPKAQLYCYADGCCYQAERNTVVGLACPPSHEEATLQYWRHKFQGQTQRFEEVVHERDAHGNRTFQFMSIQGKTTVIYDESRDRVVKVVRYGSY
jgi:hypothetical protein